MKVEISKGDDTKEVKIESGGVEIQVRETRSGMEVWFKGQCVWPPKREAGSFKAGKTSSGGTPWHLR